MSKSRLGESLMRTIEGGKEKSESKQDSVVDDAFDQAQKNDSVNILNGAEDKNDVVTSAANSEAANSEEDLIVASDQIEIELPITPKPKKIARETQKKGGGVLIGVSIILALVAVVSSGYSVMNQKLADSAMISNFEDLELVVGRLSGKTDQLTVDLSGAETQIQSNKEHLGEIDVLRGDVQIIRSTISDIRSELEGFKTSLQSQGEILDEQQKTLKGFGDQIKKLKVSTKATKAPKKVVRKEPVKNTTNRPDPNRLEGAAVASIDLWGTQPYVMLRENDGSWVPLTMGDFYKGWQLTGAVGTEAIFKRGSKTKRLAIKE